MSPSHAPPDDAPTVTVPGPLPFDDIDDLSRRFAAALAAPGPADTRQGRALQAAAALVLGCDRPGVAHLAHAIMRAMTRDGHVLGLHDGGDS